VDSVSEATLRDSLERFKAISQRLAHLIGATVDGWDPAQKALQAAFPGITLVECHLHALLKLGQYLLLQRNVAFDRIGQKQKGMVSFSINQ
jgi:hypothetical protein